jgi:hypothetical protein
VQLVPVVRRDLFAGDYLSKSMNENSPFENYYVRVWLAGMIDVAGRITTAAAINGPFIINITDTLVTERVPSTLSFS